MSSKARRKLRDAIPNDEAVWNSKTIAALAVILVCVCLLLFGLSKLKRSQVGAIPNVFEGRIVEKLIASNETEEGSNPYYRVLVEIDGQQRLSVPVNRDIYDQAQVGMILKRTEKGLEVVRAPSR